MVIMCDGIMSSTRASPSLETLSTVNIENVSTIRIILKYIIRNVYAFAAGRFPYV